MSNGTPHKNRPAGGTARCGWSGHHSPAAGRLTRQVTRRLPRGAARRLRRHLAVAAGGAALAVAALSLRHGQVLRWR